MSKRTGFFTIGYFGVPGRTGGMTHMVNQSTKKAVCGARFVPASEYQWCYPHWQMGTPECRRCNEIRTDMLIAFNQDTKEQQEKAMPKQIKKSKMDVHFSSDKAEWATPDFLFRWLDNQYHFTLDPCCTHETAKCKKHFTIKENGLEQDWDKEVVFMNPPYGRTIGAWMKKAYEESLKFGATVVCLIPARTDTKWWYDYCLQADSIIFLTGRVKFVEDGVALKAGAPFPSAIVTFKAPHSPPRLDITWERLSHIQRYADFHK
jgi:phage N-6-adenine-methyltransferase